MKIDFNALKQASYNKSAALLLEVSKLKYIVHIKNFRDINKIDENGNNALHRAIIENNIEQVKSVLQSQSVVKENLAIWGKNNQGLTPLDLVLEKANTEPCKFSIELKKIVINAQDRHGNTALHKAILENDIAKTQSLIQHGADIFLRNDNGMCALQLLFDQKEQGIDKNFDELLTLIVNAQDSYGNSILHYMAFNPDLLVIQKYEDIIDRFTKDLIKHSKFFIENLKAKEVGTKQKLCVDHSSDINKQNNQGYAPLHCAVKAKNDFLVRIILLNHNADINIQDNQGQTPLHHAVAEGNITLIRTLLTHGANFDLSDAKGHTPLDYAKTKLFYNNIKNDFKSQAHSAADASLAAPISLENFSTSDIAQEQDQNQDANCSGEIEH